MLHSKGQNWANLEDKWKNGRFIVKQKVNRYVEKLGQDIERTEWGILDNCPYFEVRDDEMFKTLLDNDLVEP